MADEPDLLAGELALGVLEGDELAAARRRELREPEFAADVAWWQQRFGSMMEQVEPSLPSAEVWRAIAARIAGEEAIVPVRLAARGPSRWSIATALAGIGAAAAAIVLYVSTPTTMPVPAPSTPSEVLIAQLSDAETGMRLASVVDPATARLSLAISGLTTREDGTVPELWVVPEGGAPVSLGLIPENGAFTPDLTAQQAELLVAGATLAVTFEQADGAPHAAPTPPIVLAGSLDEV